MIEKLKYDYTMSMPLADDFIKEAATAAAPELFRAKEAVCQGAATDLRLASSYSTSGWDTVTVCYITDLNKAISSQKTYPLEMNHVVTEDGITYQLQAKFQPWKIVTGGDGGNINLEIPFSNGGTFSKGGTSFPITSADAVIQVCLQYLPAQEKVAEPGEYKLKIRTASENNEKKPISVIDFTSNLPSISVAPAVQALLSDWLNSAETLKAIDVLFATAMLNMGTSKEFSWLVPTYASYAYTDVGRDPAKSKFGVLCMLMDRTPPAIHQMPAITFQEGCNSAFLIDRAVYAQYQLLPALPQAFENASAKDFTLGKEGISITAKGLAMPPVRYGAEDYHPRLKAMSITLNETAIVCRLDIETEISPGITAITFVETSHGMTLGKNKNNEPIMVYYEASPTVTRNSTKVEAWVIVTEILAGIIVAVAALAAGTAVQTFVQRIIIAVICAVIIAVISSVIHVIIEKVIAEGVTAGIPDITPMIKAATQYVKWPFLSEENTMDFKIKKIEFNGALCFEGVIS